ncbi:MAG: phosphonate ABC transporter ATP-binding protein [Deltaproteobacteria bacterium]|jgi:phosphonate transport system ATP-binding protein|nr:phosphonate ABC transporter ATP-binding protein [Deltaproteobacteria bacterium]
MLEVTNLSKTYGDTKVLSDISFKVGSGEMAALIGASGSGKSTLLRHISGLLASDRGSGRIRVNSRPIQSDGRLSKDIRESRRDIGMVFQQFNLVSRLTVRTNVLLGALGRTPLWRLILNAFPEEEIRLAEEALYKVGILDKSGQRASALSGGQQQRAAIARTLVQKASLILADEPIASLDPESSVMVMETLKKLNEEENLTVVVSLHQIDYAVRYCPRVIALGGGRILYDGPSRNLTAETIRAVYGLSAASRFGSFAETAAASGKAGAAGAASGPGTEPDGLGAGFFHA